MDLITESNLRGVETIQIEIDLSSILNWNVSVGNWDVVEKSLCKSGSDDGARVGGITLEMKKVGSPNILYFLSGDFKDWGA